MEFKEHIRLHLWKETEHQRFTDVETGETYTIGYISPGMSGKIKLQKAIGMVRNVFYERSSREIKSMDDII